MNTKFHSNALTIPAGRVAGRALMAGLLALASLALTTQSAKAQLTIDNFSSGFYSKTLTAGHDFNTQTGSMAGGNRYTSYIACPDVNCGGGGVGLNPFDQPSSFQIKKGTKTTKSALLYNSGYKTYPALTIEYGTGSPMSLDLSSDYAIRFNFDGTNQNINMNVLLSSGGPSNVLECNVIAPGFMQSFDVDFPFANFDGTVDLSAVTFVDIEIGVSEGLNAELEFGLTSIEAVPSSEKPAPVICTGS